MRNLLIMCGLCCMVGCVWGGKFEQSSEYQKVSYQPSTLKVPSEISMVGAFEDYYPIPTTTGGGEVSLLPPGIAVR